MQLLSVYLFLSFILTLALFLPVSDQLDGVAPSQAPQRHGRRGGQEEDEENAEIHARRHRSHFGRYHGQKKPKARSQTGAEVLK